MSTLATDWDALALYVLARPGGFTVDPRTLAEPGKSGYVVSLPGHAVSVDLGYPGTTAAAILPAALADPVYANPGVWLGGWAHGKSLIIEPSVIMADRSDAITLAGALGQCSVWDLATSAEVIVTPEVC